MTEADDLAAMAAAAADAHVTGDLAAAADLYRQLAAASPGHGWELVAGDLLVEVGRDEDAAAIFRSLVAQIPEHDQGWQSLGEALGRLGRDEQAASALRTAANLRAMPIIGRTADEAAADLEHPTSDLDRRSQAMLDLLRIDDPRGRAALDGYVRSLAEVDLQHASLAVCAALAEALVALGVQDHVHIFSDGPAPDRPFLRDNLERYLATAARPRDEVGLLGRLRRRRR